MKAHLLITGVALALCAGAAHAAPARTPIHDQPTPAPADGQAQPVTPPTVEQLQAELAQARQQLDQAQTALRAMQARDEELKATVAATSATLEACKVRNVELISVGNEVLDRFKKVGISGAVLAREPFTGLHRIKLQNLAQGYEDRLYAGHYDPKRDKAPPAPPAADNVTEPSSH